MSRLLLDDLRWEAFGPPDGKHHARPEVPTRLNLATALENIHKWLDVCDKRHACYSLSLQGSNVMPARIIDLGSAKSIEKIMVLEADGLPSERYMTLSHCWGKGVSLVTTKGTLKQMERGIDVNDLPETFREAANITHALGVRYLWIDSLCIVQDDIKDWEMEAGRMASIYSGSYLNLAATHSPDSDHGIFVSRGSTIQSSSIGKTKKNKNSLFTQLVNGITFLLGKSRESVRRSHNENTCKPDGSSHEGKGFLMTRAWVLQEGLLAPRTIHFGSDEMFWECNQWPFECECGALGLQADKSWHRPSSRKPDLSYWRAAVEWYSRLDLTYPSDKLPALSGIAELVQRETGSDFLAGLWMVELPWALLWTVSNKETTKGKLVRMAPYRAPTWSWVSIGRESYRNKSTEQGVAVNLLHSTGVGIDECFKIIEANTTVLGVNPFGKVTSGFVTVEGKVYIPNSMVSFTGQFKNNLLATSYILRFDDKVLAHKNHDGAHYLHADFPLEKSTFDAKVIAEIGLLCIAVARKSWEDSGARALVVRTSKESPDRYERVGVMIVPSSMPDRWEPSEIRQICII